MTRKLVIPAFGCGALLLSLAVQNFRSVSSPLPSSPPTQRTSTPAVDTPSEFALPSRLDELTSTEKNAGAMKVLPQGAADFALGETYNLSEEGNCLRLKPDAKKTADSDEIAGVYVSSVRNIHTPSEQREAAFDHISFDYETGAPMGSAVVFEYRTVAVDDEGEGWTAWQDLSPEERGRMIALPKVAEKWQYRVVLLATDPISTPEIRNITITTYQDPKLTEAVFGSSTLSTR